MSIEDSGKTFIWKVSFLGQIAVSCFRIFSSSRLNHLQLYAEHDQLSPIAWFQKSRSKSVDGHVEREPACIFLKPEAENILDTLIVSMIIVEQKRRAENEIYHPKVH